MATDQSTGDAAGGHSRELRLRDATGSTLTNTARNNSDSNQDEEKNIKELVEAGDEEVTGFKLAIVIASVALACFLMLIDTMVTTIATFPHHMENRQAAVANNRDYRPFLALLIASSRFQTSAGTPVHINLEGNGLSLLRWRLD